MNSNMTVWVYTYTKTGSCKYNHVQNPDRNQLVQLQCNEQKKKAIIRSSQWHYMETLPESETEVVLNLKRASFFLFP